MTTQSTGPAAPRATPDRDQKHEAASPAALRGADAAEWHRYLHAEGILVQDESEDCGPWHDRVFMAEAASPAALDVPPAYEQIVKALRYPCNEPIHQQAAEAAARLTEQEERPA